MDLKMSESMKNSSLINNVDFKMDLKISEHVENGVYLILTLNYLWKLIYLKWLLTMLMNAGIYIVFGKRENIVEMYISLLMQ